MNLKEKNYRIMNLKQFTFSIFKNASSAKIIQIMKNLYQVVLNMVSMMKRPTMDLTLTNKNIVFA